MSRRAARRFPDAQSLLRDVEGKSELDAVKPGLTVAYAIEGANMGNQADSMTLALRFPDSNQAGCGLPDLGSGPGCPERAWPTRIDPGAWTTAGGLPAGFGPLDPLDVATASFSVTVPREWEGMRDTAYEFEVKVESPGTGLDPPVSRAFVVRHTVLATKESMTRFIRHEVLELIASLGKANAAGVPTGGLKPIAAHPVLQKVEQALALILGGDLDKASGPLTSGVKVTRRGAPQPAVPARAQPSRFSMNWGYISMKLPRV